jgi:hypothetical protein
LRPRDSPDRCANGASIVRSVASICFRVFQPLLIDQILEEPDEFGHIRWTKSNFQLFVDPEITYEQA